MTRQFNIASTNAPRRVRTITATGSINLDDGLVIVDTSAAGATITVSLPDARVIPAIAFCIKVPTVLSTGGQDVVVQGINAQTIDGAASVTMSSPQQVLIVKSDGSNWQNVSTTAGSVSALDWKDSVRVATVAAGALATSFEAGDTIDGITLVEGDRILIKDQAAGAENGIYVVQASGAPVRASDADTNEKVTSGLAVEVNEGNANAGSFWQLVTNNPITLGTTALVFDSLTVLQTLAETLVAGNTTGGTDIVVDNGDSILPAVSAGGGGGGTSTVGSQTLRYAEANVNRIAAGEEDFSDGSPGAQNAVFGDLAAGDQGITLLGTGASQLRLTATDSSTAFRGVIEYRDSTTSYDIYAEGGRILTINTVRWTPQAVPLDLGLTGNRWNTLFCETVDAEGNQIYSEMQALQTPSGTAVTVDFASGNNAQVSFASASGDVTFTLDNPEPGAVYEIRIVQAAGAPFRNALWPASVFWEGGTAPTITASANAVDLIRFFYDGANFLGSFVQNLSP